MRLVIGGLVTILAGAVGLWLSIRAYRGRHVGLRRLTRKMRARGAVGIVIGPAIMAAGVAFLALGITGDTSNPIGVLGMVAFLAALVLGAVGFLWSLVIVVTGERALPPPFRKGPHPAHDAPAPTWPMAEDRRG